MLLSTFEGKARTILGVYYDERHTIYKSKDIIAVMNIIQKVFCSDIQSQELRNIYFKKKLQLSDVNLRCYMYVKMELFCGYKQIYQIPNRPHRPQKQENQYFHDFLMEFT